MTTAMYGEGGKTQDAQRKLMEFSRVAGQHVGCACVIFLTVLAVDFIYHIYFIDQVPIIFRDMHKG